MKNYFWTNLWHKTRKHSLCILILGILFIGCSQGPSVKENVIKDGIRLNQIGYYPEAIKKAVIVDSPSSLNFTLVNTQTDEIVFGGKLSEPKDWSLAGEKVRLADFTSFQEEGEYALHIEGFGQSFPFQIAKNVLKPVFLGSIKALYYQRVSTALEEKYAGKWKRPMGHPDDSVLYHPSSGYSSGFRSSPGGWYDAGDYNKYIVNASFPLGQLLLLEEQYPNVLEDNALNIPESNNGVSDYLDELRYEINWTMTMQDTDGGLFHKLTTKSFEGMVMPDEAINQRYVVGKGTAASLDFAASSAMASRIFSVIDADFAKECLERSKGAYIWAQKNPDIAFQNPEDISTGEYGDKNFDDEWFWATAELFLATEDTMYLDILAEQALNFSFNAGESWTGFMRFIGMFSLLEHKDKLPEALYKALEEGILQEGAVLVERTKELAYFQAVDDFQWGSNSDVLNAAMVIAAAYRINRDSSYLAAVQQSANYVLGTNATGYSFVTGYGKKTPMFIHHRQSAADRIVEPVPGLLSGGPNSRQQDASAGVSYPEAVAPMKSWVDVEESFASNEICLNWNAPLTYILGFLENESN